MGFKDLTNTQIVVFILGVVFSVLAVASVFWAFKYSAKIKSKVKIILYTMVLPFIAITSWLILIFSFVDGFKQDDVLNIFVSLALSIVICFMILTVAYVLYQKHKAKFVEETASQEVVEEKITVVENENVAPIEEPNEESNEVVVEEPTNDSHETKEVTEETPTDTDTTDAE